MFLKGISINTDTAICLGITRIIRKDNYDFIVVTDISSPTGIMAVSYLRRHKIPYWIEGDGGVAKSGKGIKQKLKKYVISGADGCFSTSRLHDEYYFAYGATPEKIHRYPFTSISEKDIKEADASLSIGREFYKGKLGMSEPLIVLSVGRFSYEKGYGKGFDYLMKIAKDMGSSYGFYIVGDEPTEEFLTWKKEQCLDNVHFVGFMGKKELADYYLASDCFILLTKGEAWGLVINEAMLFSLPVITTSKCVAGTELVENGINGYLVSTDNLSEVEKTIVVATENNSWGLSGHNKIQSYTIEQMVRVHISVFTEAQAKKNNGNTVDG